MAVLSAALIEWASVLVAISRRATPCCARRRFPGLPSMARWRVAMIGFPFSATTSAVRVGSSRSRSGRMTGVSSPWVEIELHIALGESRCSVVG